MTTDKTLATVKHGGCVQLPASERERFEAWHREKFKTRWQTGAPTRDMHNGVYADNYGPAEQQERWELWQAATAALSAQPSPGGQGDARALIQRYDAAGAKFRESLMDDHYSDAQRVGFRQELAAVQDELIAVLAATGKQQVGDDCIAVLSARIAFEVEICGSLQRVAKELGIDVGYLSRLARGEKTNPSDEILEKLGLERILTYAPIKREYAASPLHPRTKSA